MTENRDGINRDEQKEQSEKLVAKLVGAIDAHPDKVQKGHF